MNTIDVMFGFVVGCVLAALCWMAGRQYERTQVMSESKSIDANRLRAVWNGYHNSVASAKGMKSGKAIENAKAYERELRELLWTYRDELVDLAAPRSTWGM